jgi:Domain of unknown function (DUF4390)
MNRRLTFCAAVALLVASGLLTATESLRIVPLVHEKQVVVTVEMADAYTDDVRDVISSGLRTTFTYDVQLRMLVAGWVDRTVATAVVSVTDQYDNLTRRHSLSRSIDGRTDDAAVTEDEAVVRRWLTTLTRVPLCDTGKLERNRDYYVRVSARKRPQHGTLPFAFSSISGQAKFTFIP